MAPHYFSLLTRHVISALLISWSVSGASAPEGYEYGYVNFGEAEPQKLQPSEKLINGDQFGKVVAMYNGIAAISSGEMAVDSSTQEVGVRGKVFLFHRNYLRLWEDSNQAFTSGYVGDGYGTSVALYDSLMVVGAPKDSTYGTYQGKAYVYTGSPLQNAFHLYTNEDTQDNDYFGHSVAIVEGNANYYGSGMIVVGAYGHNKDKEHEATGCVFVFAKTGSNVWSQVGIVEASKQVDHGGFGYSLSAFRNSLVVGSYGSDLVYFFELEGHVHECPPHAKEDEEIPADCPGGSNDQSGDGASNAEERRQLRRLQGPEEDKNFYTEWKYTEELVVGFDNHEGHDPKDKATIRHFGAAVAIYNNSGLVTVAVGCALCETSLGVQTGGVFVLTKLNKGDLVYGWYPEGYDPHEGEKKRMLQEGPEDEHRKLWNPMEQESHASATGEFWYSEVSFFGRVQYENFGWSIAIDKSTLLIGSNPKTLQQGRAEVYSRTAKKGGLNFVLSGPLSNTKWAWASDLHHMSGVTGDKFGFSVALEGDTAMVGTILSDLTSDGTFGTGATYVFDRVYLRPKKTPSPTPAPQQETLMDELADTSSAIGISFVSFSSIIGFCAMLAIFYGAYRLQGGEKSPKALTMQMFGYGEDIRKSSRPIHLTRAMDDSTSSVGSTSSAGGLLHPGHGNSSAYSGLNASSSHSSQPGKKQFKPRPQYVPKGPPRPSYTRPSSSASPSSVGSRNSFKGKGLDDL